MDLLDLNSVVHLDLTELDAAIEKANQLLAILERAKEISKPQNSSEA